MEKSKPATSVGRDSLPVAAVDARSIVPVADEIGGVVIYVGGHPAYYVLSGEWFSAVPAPQESDAGDAGKTGNVLLGDVDGDGWPSRAGGIVSTS